MFDRVMNSAICPKYRVMNSANFYEAGNLVGPFTLMKRLAALGRRRLCLPIFGAFV